MVAFTSKKVIIYCVCAAIFAGAAVPVAAGLPVRNMGVFSQYIGVPELQSALKLVEDEQQWQLTTTQSSHFSYYTDKKDPLYIDAESTGVDLSWRAFGLQTEWLLVLPWISYQGGFMDSAISSYHHALNLPNGNRSLAARNQLRVSYQGVDQFLLDESVNGVGDIRLQAGWQLRKSADNQHALHISLQLPTGSERLGLGSGGVDTAVFSTHAWTEGAWQQELQFGIVHMGAGDIWQQQRRQNAVFASAALLCEVADHWQAVLQYDGHSAFYQNTQQKVLGDGHLLTLGLKHKTAGFAWHVALLEDLLVQTAPDIGFQLGFQWQ